MAFSWEIYNSQRNTIDADDNILRKDDYEEVKQRFDCYEILQAAGIACERNGRNIICPLHDDTDASFSVYNNGQAFKCFGCNKQGSVIDLYMALHNVGHREAVAEMLGKSEVSPRVLASKLTKNKPKPKTRPKRKSLYRRPPGGIEYQYGPNLKKVRYKKGDKKIFGWAHQENGRWYFGRDGRAAPLYVRGGEIETGAEVYLVEGEKDVETIAGLGLIGVSKPGTGDRWEDAWLEQLADTRIVIVPDNDDAGRAFAEESIITLREHVDGWKVVDLPGLGEKEDVTDWLEAGHTAEEFKRVCNNAAWQSSRINYYEQTEGDKARMEFPLDLAGRLPGPLADYVDWYNRTAFRPQPGFAIVSALALGSIVCARNFCTTMNNFSSLFFLCIAGAGTGKEHAKRCIEKVLYGCKLAGNDELEGDSDVRALRPSWLAGAGYTSQGGVFSTLIVQPQHITIIDEFGRYLGGEKGSDNGVLKGARTALMECWGRCDGYYATRQYSMANKKTPVQENRTIEYPAITVYGMTTPETFFEAAGTGHVADGFLNRMLVYHSDYPRDINEHGLYSDPVPTRTVQWIEQIYERADRLSAMGRWKPEPLQISNAIYQDYLDFVRAMDRRTEEMEHTQYVNIYSRTAEKALRLALIITLAEDPDATEVSVAAWTYGQTMAMWFDSHLLHLLEHSMSGSAWEAAKMEVMTAMRKLGRKGITMREMKRKSPFSKYREIEEIIDHLKDAELVGELKQNKKTNKPGRPKATRYVATKPPKGE